MANVLIADNSRERQRSTRTTLERVGHTVEVARDHVAAQKLLLAGRFDCAILDESFVELYGLRLLVRIRTSYRHNPLRVLLTSSEVQEHACLMHEHHLAVDLLLAKPFAPTDVIRAVDLLLTLPERGGARLPLAYQATPQRNVPRTRVWR